MDEKYLNISIYKTPTDKAMPFLHKAVNKTDVMKSAQEALQSLLSDPGLAVHDLNIEYFHYKPGANCRLAYRFFLNNEQEVMACGEMVSENVKEPFKKGRWHRFIPSLNMTLRLLPSDKALPGLKQVMNAKWLARNAGFFTPKKKTTQWTLKKKKINIKVVNYRPHFRCLLKIDVKLTSAKERKRSTFYIKVYAAPISEENIKALELLSHSTKNSPLSLPSIAGVLLNNRALIFTNKKGMPFLEAIKIGGKEVIKQLSRSLEIIHTTPFTLKENLDYINKISKINACSNLLAKLDPVLGSLAMDISASLNLNAFRIRVLPKSLIHGDFSHEQILVNGSEIIILDFDKLSYGDYREDLGNFCANIIEACISGIISEQHASTIIENFLTGYNSLKDNPIELEAIKWYTAYCLLKLAIRPFRRVEKGWGKRAKDILTFAQQIIDNKCNDLFPNSFSVFLSERDLNNSSENSSDHEFSLDAVLSKIKKLESKKDALQIKKIWPASKGRWFFLFQKKEEAKEQPYFYAKILQSGKIKYNAFPDDHILVNLNRALDKNQIQRYLRNRIPLSYGFSVTPFVKEINIISYKPEHRCQIEYLITTGTKPKSKAKLFGKLYRSIEDCQAAYDATSYFSRLMAESDQSVIKDYPEPFIIPELNAVFLREIDGISFNTILSDDPHESIVENIAVSLKNLHSGKFTPLRIHSWEHEIKVMKKWTAAANHLYPFPFSSINRLMNSILEKGKSVNTKSHSLVHCDFYDKQIIVNGNAIAFLDFDSFSIGDPAIDIGNFLAHLALRGIQKTGNPKHYNRIKKCFLAAYTNNNNEVDLFKRIELYLLSSLLRLSCVYMLRSKGKVLIYSILKETEKILQKGE